MLQLTYMALVAYVGCGLEPKARTGGGGNPIRGTKKRLDKEVFINGRVCVCMRTSEREGESPPAKYTYPLSLYAITGFGRR